MKAGAGTSTRELMQRLAEAEATVAALLSGQIDAVVDPRSNTPVLLSKAQEALRESEERYRRIVETANEGISILDKGSRITFANRRFSEMLGYEEGELLGKTLLQIVPAAAAASAALRAEHSREGKSEEHETSYLRKDGSELWAFIRTSPISDSRGGWLGTLGMITDRTHYRRAEEALRKSEEQYRQIVEATPNGILQIDRDARTVFANAPLAEMLGYSQGEMVGRSLLDFVAPAARADVAKSIEARKRGAHASLDTTYRRRNGSDLSVNVVTTALFDAGGEYIGTLGIIRDITGQKRLQAQLMVSDRMVSVGTLAAGVAHEINNPLAAVIANLDVAAESLAPRNASDTAPAAAGRSAALLLQDARESIRDAMEAAARVRFIVRDLMVFSRSPAEESRGPVDVNAILESSLRMAWNEIRHRARLVKNYATVPEVDANEARLGQVFLNLIVNAAQAIQEGRAESNEIRIATRLEGERVLVEVSDTGPGIPAENLGRIFDAFFTTKAVGVGTGLGLAICLRIVTDLGGELTVESEPGKGTTFRVSLPVARHKQREAAPPLAPLPQAALRGRILVVDDEKAVLSVIRRILASQHEVVTQTSAKEALALCVAGEKFDLILCDLMMPDMTGMDLHRELQRVVPEQASRMIFLTGGAFTAQARSFLAEALKEHIEKPFDSGNLRAIVQRYLR